MKIRINTYLKSSFLKNVSYLITGAVAGQVVAVALTPVLSRFYDPSDFGYLGSVVTLSGIIATTGTLRYEMGIVQTKGPIERESLTQLSLILLLIFSTALGIIFLIRPMLIELLGISRVDTNTILLVCLIGLFLGAGNIYTQWHNSVKGYKLLSQKSVITKVSTVLFQLAWVLIISTGIGLVLGNLMGAVFGFLFLLFPVIRSGVSAKINIGLLQKYAKKYYRFALYSTPQNLLNAISQGLPIFMLGSFFGTSVVGAYFFAMRILQLPASLISSSIRQVFYKEAVDFQHDHRQLKKKYFKLTFTLFSIILIPIIIIFVWGTTLFSWIFGPEWSTAGSFASWMFLWVGLMFVNPPSSAMYYVLNRQKQQLIFEIVLFLCRLGCLYFGGISKDVILTIKLYSIVGVVFNLFFVGYIMIILMDESNYRR